MFCLGYIITVSILITITGRVALLFFITQLLLLLTLPLLLLPYYLIVSSLLFNSHYYSLAGYLTLIALICSPCPAPARHVARFTKSPASILWLNCEYWKRLVASVATCRRPAACVVTIVLTPDFSCLPHRTHSVLTTNIHNRLIRAFLLLSARHVLTTVAQLQYVVIQGSAGAGRIRHSASRSLGLATRVARPVSRALLSVRVLILLIVIVTAVCILYNTLDEDGIRTRALTD